MHFLVENNMKRRSSLVHWQTILVIMQNFRTISVHSCNIRTLWWLPSHCANYFNKYYLYTIIKHFINIQHTLPAKKKKSTREDAIFIAKIINYNQYKCFENFKAKTLFSLIWKAKYIGYKPTLYTVLLETVISFQKWHTICYIHRILKCFRFLCFIRLVQWWLISWNISRFRFRVLQFNYYNYII